MFNNFDGLYHKYEDYRVLPNTEKPPEPQSITLKKEGTFAKAYLPYHTKGFKANEYRINNYNIKYSKPDHKTNEKQIQNSLNLQNNNISDNSIERDLNGVEEKKMIGLIVRVVRVTEAPTNTPITRKVIKRNNARSVLVTSPSYVNR